ncbi:MAG TPA: polyhydroxyalkanoate synthesis regulator DNA-binding domain-containing protein [Polyangiaceae bacterium]|jgi:polyhydroxyalkanoate synthesis repressor PhaR|nr:polyhydroxyalkanoate synthesis regulator DNA-binding domain-containing protein [Polyangiaceae bacterium]
MVSEVPESGSTAERRVIKRYSNRKLYDTKDSRYVTLLQIAEMIRANEDVQIIDNATKEDKTDVTLALIISEELKARPRGIPLATLKALIRQRSEKILTHFRDSPIRRLISKEHPEEGGEAIEGTPLPEEDDVTGSETQQKGIRATLEQWQHAIDERIRAVLPNFSPIRELQSELKRVSDRLAAIEKKLEKLDEKPKE